jgi:hypothetical protein
MRGRAALSDKRFEAKRYPPVDPSSVGFAATFSRKGRRNNNGADHSAAILAE